jgi:macrolide-specific efflux system membrane fusion protein
MGGSAVNRGLRNVVILLFSSTLTLLGTAAGNAADTIIVDSVLLTPIQEVEVPAQEAGILDRIVVREGTVVAQDELAAQLDDTDARLQRGRANLELQNTRRNAENDIKVRVAEKGAAVAAAELQRALDSRERYAKSVSETEVDRLRLTAEHAELQLEQARYDFATAQLAVKVAENELQRAERQVERRRIEAPVPGRIVQVFRRQGEWVEPGQTVFRILRIDRLKAVGFLEAAQLTDDLTGRPVTLSVTSPTGDIDQYPGEVKFVHSEVNPVSGQVDFWAEIDNSDLRLRPGQRGQLSIDAGQAETQP